MIKVYNRSTKMYETENVAGKKYLEWCYGSILGKKATEIFIKRKLFTKLYGKFCDSKASCKKIQPFIDEFDIDMTEVIKKPSEFENFNDFFARKLKKHARPFSLNKDDLISPGDGRLTVLTNIDTESLVQIKDLTYSLSELLGDTKTAALYEGGTCLILRLCPLDYHRYHFIDNGICSEGHKINGSYYSVNPIALKNTPKLFCQNKREWSTFKSENFGDIITVEVGATCVGSIIQTYHAGESVKRGDEKGYFKFGGSTTIFFFKKDTVVIDEDILEQSAKGCETHVKFGETIGKAVNR
ncbi:MAG: phosphatidylserine decarboxylase [Inconstantimicrobium porci]|uniref:Phosphatidylserine decarboxylase proenzyme n=1 Tax=Inconstantimicrobium porci TaxID=2652291 RepID=A0A7X2N0U1_9CLOT|nr:phosphatidylserine decarboxylase [Inconstantimicrobium porci]MDD6769306.1 phosphatidylserine decarboxylase [Inconstantimicrobium porci]MDY5911478.1 phosphatidylserine decarboxylase [Inconstantimicrobium porci]MSR92605.1 phosphatidylserine decarboxylase [Inconstantimicrobium porci]